MKRIERRRTYKCEECGAQIFGHLSRPRKYCSRKCYAKASTIGFDLKAWRARNMAHLAAAERARNAANPQRARERRKRWRKKNKRLIAAMAAVRRSLKSATGAASTRQLIERDAQANGKCVYCGVNCVTLQYDHFDPVSRGGTSELSNIIMCCPACNRSKSNRIGEDWLFEQHGAIGLARALLFLEGRQIPLGLERAT